MSQFYATEQKNNHVLVLAHLEQCLLQVSEADGKRKKDGRILSSRIIKSTSLFVFNEVVFFADAQLLIDCL